MRTKPFLQSAIAASMLFGCGMLVSCNFTVNGSVTTETSPDSDTVIIKITSNATTAPLDETDSIEVEEEEVSGSYSMKDMVGIYDTDNNDRLCFDSDGTGSSGIIGSLNFTSFEYSVEGNEIVMIWGDGEETRLKIRNGGKAIYWPEDDLTFIKEEDE